MSSPPPDNDILIQSFLVSLTVYSKVKKVSLKGKTTSKEEKSTKMKELLFALDESNYTEFLQAILCKHSLDDYMVTEKKHFPLKYIPPKAKGQHMSDAINVNDIADYREMVKKIAEETPPVMKGTPNHTKEADLDNHLAWWQLKLQKAYKNKHNEGLTYIRPLGPIPLTPTMVHDWCLALEDGQATIAIPPNIELFNMANKAPVLHHACKMSTQAAPTPTADLNLLTSAILLCMLAQFDSSILHFPTTPPSASVTPIPSVPQTPTQQHVAEGGDTPSSPPIPSPSQLSHYLHPPGCVQCSIVSLHTQNEWNWA
ncbi:hypothetical protein EDC04DRAFT_2898851 [Pisolithus marmoratus]|nr:hypothetical protein EDC04DRAFT_2898851 [Pisolithus marmoratus]